MLNISYVALGLTVGLLSGFLGLGGGLIMVPVLVFFFGFTQHQAQGTSLAAMIPPVTLLAALRYYYGGNVKVDVAILLACGFVAGGWLGANAVQGIPEAVLKKIFGIFLLFVSIKMIFVK